MLRDVLKPTPRDWATGIGIALVCWALLWLVAGAMFAVSPPVHLTMSETAGVHQAR